MMSLRERFDALREFFDQEEAELVAESARRDSGDKIRESLWLSAMFLGDYQKQLEIPTMSAWEDDRAWHKADLHSRWRECHHRRT